MISKAPLKFLIILMVFSFLLSSSAFHTRRLLPNREKSSAQTTLVVQEEQGFGEEIVDMEEEGRMDLESNDYPGTGANNRHDPKTPGRSDHLN